jgi:hypothetical protein
MSSSLSRGREVLETAAGRSARLFGNGTSESDEESKSTKGLDGALDKLFRFAGGGEWTSV